MNNKFISIICLIISLIMSFVVIINPNFNGTVYVFSFFSGVFMFSFAAFLNKE